MFNSAQQSVCMHACICTSVRTNRHTESKPQNAELFSNSLKGTTPTSSKQMWKVTSQR